MESKQSILELDHVGHTFREERSKVLTVMHDISFNVGVGEFVSIIGPSGGGKSTLLRSIAGLITPSHGKIISNAKKVSMVFQNVAIFPWLSVIENVEFGLKMAGLPSGERRKIAREVIAEVKLSGKEESHIRELSGGEKSRVGIARALTLSPDLLLLDEPFSSLDEITASKLREDLLDLWRRRKMTVLMVTHLIEEAVSLSDRVVVISKVPATVKEIVPINLARPRKKRSEEYFALVDKITNLIEE